MKNLSTVRQGFLNGTPGCWLIATGVMVSCSIDLGTLQDSAPGDCAQGVCGGSAGFGGQSDGGAGSAENRGTGGAFSGGSPGDGGASGDGGISGDGGSFGDGGMAGGPSGDGGAPLSCAEETRTIVSDAVGVERAIGQVRISEGTTCTGAIIAPDKVLTSAGCVESSLPIDIEFSVRVPEGEQPYVVVGERVVQGRDVGDLSRHGDWAIVTFSDADFEAALGSWYRPMRRSFRELSSDEITVTVVGYDSDLLGWGEAPSPVVRRTCQWLSAGANKPASPPTNCDLADGAQGAPHYDVVGGVAEVVGVSSFENSAFACTQDDGAASNVANGTWFARAPDGVGGIAAVQYDGEATVFSTDPDWATIAMRPSFHLLDEPFWHPWETHEVAFENGGAISVVELADSRISLYVVRNESLWVRWQLSAPYYFSNWVNYPIPEPIVDVVATGEEGVRTHAFILAPSGNIWGANKLSDNASSDWTDWELLGSHPGARSIDGSYFSGKHVVVTGGSDGVRTIIGASGNYGEMFIDGSETDVLAVAAGKNSSGGLSILAANESGVIRGRNYNRAFSAGADWGNMITELPAGVANYEDLAFGRTPQGRAQLFALGSNGNLYATVEDERVVFYFPWERFYK